MTAADLSWIGAAASLAFGVIGFAVALVLLRQLQQTQRERRRLIAAGDEAIALTRALMNCIRLAAGLYQVSPGVFRFAMIRLVETIKEEQEEE